MWEMIQTRKIRTSIKKKIQFLLNFAAEEEKSKEVKKSALSVYTLKKFLHFYGQANLLLKKTNNKIKPSQYFFLKAKGRHICSCKTGNKTNEQSVAGECQNS